MNTIMKIIAQSNVNCDSYTPMSIEGEDHGVVHFIRNDENNGRVYRSALWKLEESDLPYASPYVFVNDETMMILEGELEMTFEDGGKTVLRKGDIASFAAGTKTEWVINKPFKKFVVETSA